MAASRTKYLYAQMYQDSPDQDLYLKVPTGLKMDSGSGLSIKTIELIPDFDGFDTWNGNQARLVVAVLRGDRTGDTPTLSDVFQAPKHLLYMDGWLNSDSGGALASNLGETKSFSAAFGAGTILVANDFMTVMMESTNTGVVNRVLVRIGYVLTALTEAEKVQLLYAND